MSARDRLIAACEDGDSLAVHREGWGTPWQLLAEIASPKQGCTIKELAPYVRLLGDHEPADVVEAIEACADEWRPTPGALRGYLNRKRGDAAKVDAGRCHDRASTTEALRAVAAALDAGEALCDCGVRRPTWRIDHAHVLRCVACGGLEHGQAYAVEDQESAA